jgi:defect-in-organelle-trafficking protein DotC
MADLPPMTLTELQSIYIGDDKQIDKSNPQSLQQFKIMRDSLNVGESARKEAILDTGLSIGVKGGLAYQLNNIRNSVSEHERDFDTLYDFSTLMIQDRVIPPVITQAKDLYNQDGDFALRLSSTYYEIVTQAKFSSVPPNWRGYLTFPKSGFTADFINTGLKPKGSEEIKLFNLAISDGWLQGVDQANLMLTNALDRLNRDFKGMLLFHQLVIEGKITMPIIASSQISVTNDGNKMSVDNTLLRITKLPEFDSNTAQWHSSFASKEPDSRVFDKLKSGIK